MQGIWLPSWLYRFLPLIYLVCGTVMLFVFGEDTIGRLSGLLLYAAALLIWVLRLQARVRTPPREP
jgi:hypothetical protein